MDHPHPSTFGHANRRIRFLARAILPVFLGSWLASFFPWNDLLSRQGTPLGADFLMFYVAGQVVRDGEVNRLYDQSEHQQRLHEQFPALNREFCLPFRYPPFVAWGCVPLARLPYPAAWCCFTGLSLAAWLLTVRLLAREVLSTRLFDAATGGWALAAWPIALETLIGGQASAFAAFIVVGSVAMLRRNHYVVAGMLLALSAYKPNVLVLFAAGVCVRYPRMLCGAVPVVLALAAICLAMGGTPVIEEYLALTLHLTDGPWDVETPFWKVHGLSPWFVMALPDSGRMFSAAIGLFAAVIVGVYWRMHDRTSPTGLEGAAALLLGINALFNPYTPIYDLLLLAPAAVYALRDSKGVGGSSRITAGGLSLGFGLWFFGPHVSQALAQIIGVQCFPLALAGVMAWFVGRRFQAHLSWRPARSSAAHAAAPSLTSRSETGSMGVPASVPAARDGFRRGMR